MKLLNDISHRFDNDLVFQYPCERFFSMNVVNVGLNQCAVFVRRGMIADVLGPGRHPLEPENIPLLMGILNRMSGQGPSVFHAQVYFFNMSCVTDLKFGTSMKLCEYADEEIVPGGGMLPITAGVFGRYQLRIVDPVLLLETLLADRITLDRKHLERYFYSLLVSSIIPVLREIIDREQISVFELEKYLTVFSREAQQAVSMYFEEIGLKLLRINIEGFSAEEDPVYQRLVKIYLYAAASLAKAEADARANRILDTTYAEREQYRIFDIMSRRSSVNRATDAAVDFASIRAVSDLFYRGLNHSLNSREEDRHPAGQQICPVCGRANPPEAHYCMFCTTDLRKAGRGDYEEN